MNNPIYFLIFICHSHFLNFIFKINTDCRRERREKQNCTLKVGDSHRVWKVIYLFSVENFIQSEGVFDLHDYSHCLIATINCFIDMPICVIFRCIYILRVSAKCILLVFISLSLLPKHLNMRIRVCEYMSGRRIYMHVSYVNRWYFIYVYFLLCPIVVFACIVSLAVASKIMLFSELKPNKMWKKKHCTVFVMYQSFFFSFLLELELMVIPVFINCVFSLQLFAVPTDRNTKNERKKK